MHTKKPIRFSKWTVQEGKNKNKIHVIDEIIVSGNEEDIELIKKNSLYLGNVYRAVYGKERFIEKRKQSTLTVLKVSLHDKILGYTVK